MGQLSRRKGRRYEQVLVQRFREAVPGLAVRRGAQARGGHEAPDVDVPGLWVEAKHGRCVNLRAALAQAETSPNRLLFALPKFTAPVHVSGTPRITLRLACDKPATNLSVWLVSLPWQGGRRITDDVVTRGWADPQNRNSLTKGEPLVPGTFYDVSFDLQPDDQVLAAGEQLALMVMASDNEFTLHPKAGAKLTIDLDGSSLVVPVVGGEQALRAAVGAGK